MTRTVAIGSQDFDTLIRDNCFYIDKTKFIQEWWESKDQVTLITRPRRFGKTLNMNMLERFFSNQYKGKGEIFESLDIWKDEKFRDLQGTYPVLFLSFAGIKSGSYNAARQQICRLLSDIYEEHRYLLDGDCLSENEKSNYRKMSASMDDVQAAMALHDISNYLSRYYGRKVIILLDEYDTPLQEAYVNGYWKELVAFTRNLFNNTFKTNPYLERAVMTGITNQFSWKFAMQTSHSSAKAELLFSDLNNLNVITMTSKKYASYFGFTESEVFAAMDEFGLTNKDEVKSWYDGFTIGNLTDIYNPWSIINFLDKQELKPYWANTSSNSLAGSLIQTGNIDVKMHFEDLLGGHSIYSEIDEKIVFDQLDNNDESAIWSLLLASGYLKVLEIQDERYELGLTNYEVHRMFESLVKGWFRRDRTHYNQFIKALLCADVEAMNEYMDRFALNTFSYFDVGGNSVRKDGTGTVLPWFCAGTASGLKGQI